MNEAVPQPGGRIEVGLRWPGAEDPLEPVSSPTGGREKSLAQLYTPARTLHPRTLFHDVVLIEALCLKEARELPSMRVPGFTDSFVLLALTLLSGLLGS